MRRSFVFVAFIVACRAGGTPIDRGGPGTATEASARALVEHAIDARLEESPSFARELGLHQYDGKVAAIGGDAIAARIRRAHALVDAIAAIDLATLEDPTRLDLELVRGDAEKTIFELETLRRHRQIMTYNDLFDVSAYVIRDYAPLANRIESLVDHLDAAAKQLPNVFEVLDELQVRTHLETAKNQHIGMKEYFTKDVADLAKPAIANDERLEKRYATAIASAIAGTDRIIAWIDAHMKQSTDDFALGETNFLRMLRVNEGLDTSLAELESMAKADHAKNFATLTAIAKKMSPNESVEAVYARVANDRLPRDGVLTAARRQLDQLLAFLETKHLVTLPSLDRATVEISPPFMRWNSAFLNSAGPFEAAKGSFYYISPPDPSWSAEDQAAYIPFEGDLLATSIHEVYPGHFVHSLFQARARTRAQKVFASYAFTEGWAHYVEQMMLDEGFGGGDPKLAIGQLSNALLRNCRFIAAIALHTKGMTVDEANRLFQKECLIDPGNAIQQAYRGTFDPGYLSYTLGKLQILELRERFAKTRGTRDLAAFHDWLLSFGATPIALIAKRL